MPPQLAGCWEDLVSCFELSPVISATISAQALKNIPHFIRRHAPKLLDWNKAAGAGCENLKRGSIERGELARRGL